MPKLEPILTKEGVFYAPPGIKGVKCTIVLEEVNRKAKFIEDYLDNEGNVLGFSAWHKLTGDRYYIKALISKKIGDPSIHTILEVSNNNKPVDYAKNLDSALSQAHEYLFRKIIEGNVLECHDVYSNLLDTTTIGKEKFKLNKANLGASFNIKKFNENSEKILEMHLIHQKAKENQQN